jgi:hypothetical protein
LIFNWLLCVAFLFSFPKDSVIRNALLKAIRRKDPVTRKPWQPKAVDVVCSGHFKPADFVTNRGNTMLKTSAIPVIHIPEHLVSFIPTVVIFGGFMTVERIFCIAGNRIFA